MGEKQAAASSGTSTFPALQRKIDKLELEFWREMNFRSKMILIPGVTTISVPETDQKFYKTPYVFEIKNPPGTSLKHAMQKEDTNQISLSNKSEDEFFDCIALCAPTSESRVIWIRCLRSRLYTKETSKMLNNYLP